MKYFEINDAIHKTIRFNEEEKSIIDHPYMQRLRYIKQLGFASLVYPCAVHDRFSHSLGTMHVASMLAEKVFLDKEFSILAKILSDKEKEYAVSVMRLAALMHDIGHAPFSHSAEKAMPGIKELNLPENWYNEEEKRIATHEDYSVLLIANMAEKSPQVISMEKAREISSIIHHKKISLPSSWHKHFSDKINSESLHDLICELISGDIDADRMDYLLRDSYFAGVIYGHFDLPWLISNLGVAEHQNKYAISITDSGIHAFEHYLFARYHMYVQVYMHKTAKCFDYFFQQALDKDETVYSIPPDAENYASLRDSRLLEGIFRTARRQPDSWSASLINRRAANHIARIWRSETEAVAVFKKLKNDLKKIKVEPFLVSSMSKFLGTRPGKSSPFKQGTIFMGLASVPLVIMKKEFASTVHTSLEEYSFILKRYHDDIYIGDIYIPYDQYQKNENKILPILEKYRNF